MRKFSFLFFLATAIGLITSGPAAAQSWERLGGVILEEPNCVSWGENRIDCFARGTNKAMYHKWWDGRRWGGWENLGGVILEQPECISWGENRIDCFARGTNKAMYHKWWDGSRWGGWENLGGVLLEEPECVSWSPNRIDCFHRGRDGAMYHNWWDGSRWRGYENLGGVILEAPECVSWGRNRIDCFARGTDKAMYHKWWDGRRWGGWENLGGVILDKPECVSWGPNRIDCFARGTNRAMYHKWWDGSRWGGWENLRGVLTAKPECVSWGSNRIDCFHRGRDGAMYHNWWNGSRWRGYENLGGVILEQPECVSWGSNRIDCFARGRDRAMYHKWWDGRRWGPRTAEAATDGELMRISRTRLRALFGLAVGGLSAGINNYDASNGQPYDCEAEDLPDDCGPAFRAFIKNDSYVRYRPPAGLSSIGNVDVQFTPKYVWRNPFLFLLNDITMRAGAARVDSRPGAIVLSLPFESTGREVVAACHDDLRCGWGPPDGNNKPNAEVDNLVIKAPFQLSLDRGGDAPRIRVTLGELTYTADIRRAGACRDNALAVFCDLFGGDIEGRLHDGLRQSLNRFVSSSEPLVELLENAVNNVLCRMARDEGHHCSSLSSISIDSSGAIVMRF